MATDVKEKSDVATTPMVGVIHEGIPCKVGNLEACIEFYMRVFDLKRLERPKALDDLGIPGAWLADKDDKIQFHLIAKDDEIIPGPEVPITPTGRHTALRVKNIDDFRDRMRALDVPFNELSGLIGEPQLFVMDPEGHTWEFQGLNK